MGCRVGNRQYVGVASTKKEAKQIAAQAMFKSIEQGHRMDDDDGYDGNRSTTSSDCSSVKSFGATAAQSSTENVSVCESQAIDTTCIAKLITICQENCLKLPEYVSFAFELSRFWCFKCRFQLMWFALILILIYVDLNWCPRLVKITKSNSASHVSLKSMNATELHRRSSLQNKTQRWRWSN